MRYGRLDVVIWKPGFPRSVSPSTALEVAAITIGALIGAAVVWFGTGAGRSRPCSLLRASPDGTPAREAAG